MKRSAKPLLLILAALFSLLLAACGAGRPRESEAGASPQATSAGLTAEEPRESDASLGGAATAPGSVSQPVAQVQTLDRKIIKDGSFVIEVESLDNTLSRLSDLAVQSGGYVMETSTSYSGGGYARTANIRFAVPVERFEEVLQRVREGANKVVSESSSGVDVTQEYVDVESQIANLEATRERVRQFLSEAKNVEEALAVNQELSRIEGELGVLKGRLQYLSQRTAFSTITVEVRQPLPPVESAQVGWQPGEQVEEAFAALINLLQGLATLGIWLVIVGVPVLAPLALVVWVIVRWARNRPPRPRTPAPPPPPTPVK